MIAKTNVQIIVDDEVRDNEIDFGLLNTLEELGLSIDNIDHGSGFIEGVIETAKLHELKKIKYISYVREVFTYYCYGPNEGDQNDAARN